MPARNILSTLPYAAAIVFSLSAPAAFAAGEETDSTKPPEQTETTTVCTDGKIWDAEKKECAEAAAKPVQATETSPECTDGKVFDKDKKECADPAAKPVQATETNPECTDGKVFDKDKKECVDPPKSGFNDDQLYKAAREFAYAGQYDHAIHALELASNQDDPRILNYLGYANRKAGRMEVGMQYYRRAIANDANYILARSYMGQALIEQGDVDGAKVQLVEIRDRGGENTWAYRSLLQSLNGYGTY